MIILHIIIAFSSLIYTAVLYLYPSYTKLRVSYILVGVTILTGFYLVLSKPAHMTQTCITGLCYLALVSLGIVSARYKLAKIIAK
ncbi:MAG TPA: hypothetical protein VL306_01155 [Methylomirabilota bacterium]|jgi:hypothetical protein|nr:hypothetical protein [Methylomirabilota bacterium]